MPKQDAKVLKSLTKEVSFVPIITLRAHHLLCSRLFTGHGYDDRFTERMGEAVSRMRVGHYKNPVAYPMSDAVKLICSCDYVCEMCPNRINESGIKDKPDLCGCRLGTEDVHLKDKLTLKYTGLRENEAYTLEALEKAVRNITAVQFKDICGACRWYKEGYCRYEALL